MPAWSRSSGSTTGSTATACWSPACPAPRYAIYEDAQLVGEATREQLAGGLDLLQFPRLSTNRRAAEVWPLVEQKHAILRPSWLEAVGHGPPDFGKAPPLAEAKRAGRRRSRRRSGP